MSNTSSLFSGFGAVAAPAPVPDAMPMVGAGYKTKRHSSKTKRGGNQDFSKADNQMRAQYEKMMEQYKNREVDPGFRMPEMPPPSFLDQARDYLTYQLGLLPRRDRLLGRGRRRKQRRGGNREKMQPSVLPQYDPYRRDELMRSKYPYLFEQ